MSEGSLTYVRCLALSVLLHIGMVVVWSVVPSRAQDPGWLLSRVRQRPVMTEALGAKWEPLPVMVLEGVETGDMELAYIDELPDYVSDVWGSGVSEPSLPNLVRRSGSETVQERASESVFPSVEPPPPSVMEAAAPSIEPPPSSDIGTSPAMGGHEGTGTEDAAETGGGADAVTAGVAGSSDGGADAARSGVEGGSPGAAARVNSVDEEKLWEAYAARLRDFFAQKRTYPAMAKRLGQKGTVWIEMELDRTGALLGMTVVKSSGSKILDRAAEELVRGGGIPPFPEGVSEKTRRVRVPFEYRLGRR